MEVTGDKNECLSDNELIIGSENAQSLEKMTELSTSQSLLSVTGSQRYSFGHKINILRSPSRESVGTDISLFSVSTLASELTNRVKLLSVKTPGDNSISRGPSPNFDSKRKRPENIQEVWFEESNDMIKGMAAISSAVGLTKSFSTSDIISLSNNYAGNGGIDEDGATPGVYTNSSFLLNAKRNAISEVTINCIQNCSYLLDHSMTLDTVSRSCSTWVAIGDISSTSQLPSPHGGHVTSNLHSSKSSCAPSFSPADLIRSVNKKVRQHYIRRRLLNTYKALERLSQSEFNLDKLEVEAAASTKTNNPSNDTRVDSGLRRTAPNRLSVPSSKTSSSKQWKSGSFASNLEKPSVIADKLTVTDVERERGQPLSKYDRNIMIFNWLLTLDADENTLE